MISVLAKPVRQHESGASFNDMAGMAAVIDVLGGEDDVWGERPALGKLDPPSLYPFGKRRTGVYLPVDNIPVVEKLDNLPVTGLAPVFCSCPISPHISC